MNPADESGFEELLAWGRQHGAALHDQVEVYNDPLTKYSLRVKPSSPAPAPGFAVAKCPAWVTLSYLNALIGGPLLSNLSQLEASPSFPASFMSSLPPHVIGRFFLIQQYLLGPSSFWYPYIATLPQPERLASWALPAFWSLDDIEFLEGTNAEVAIDEVRDNVKDEFKRARKLLKDAAFPMWQDYSRVLYNWAFCMFTSRSFRPTTVLSEAVRRQVRRFLPPSCKDDDFSVLMPVMDIGNHDLRAKVEWDTASDIGFCRFISHDRYQPGQQIFNNYGMKTNSELLLGYGFIVPETADLHNDYIHLRKKRGPEADEVGSGNSAGETLPKDYLISLRSMEDPASVVGKSRQRLGTGGQYGAIPGLTHFEDSLIWDMVVAQAGPNLELRNVVDKLLKESPGGGDIGYCLKRLLASPMRPEHEEVVHKIWGVLLSKMGFDYDRILDAEDYEDGVPTQIPRNQNQELAAAYRRQCKKVLETNFKSLGLKLEDWRRTPGAV